MTRLRLAPLLGLLAAACATSSSPGADAPRATLLSDKPQVAIAGCLALSLDAAGLSSETIVTGDRTMVLFRAPGDRNFANATLLGASPTVIELRGQFGARMRRWVQNCL